ncbi:MAG: 1-deoxy-D-xylulose-5-phosphate synthase [Chthonomonadaceae bacterium]|nr:1-deoxy-D-xylulose-5-phosphate synthase [Chthonomonadaceae bacterium]
MTEDYGILSQIVSPTDLHKLDRQQLAQLAREVRQAILDNVSRTGGHFSSNLGTVELTVAMYASYSVPPDKVVWDTGHQAYPHKLLTGRLPRFHTLRKHKGISGFLSRKEHELDFFGAGHAGTAISAALGFAAARDQIGTKEKVVAVAGDASIASGMSWEALNHAGEMGTDICVVLNDNRMSIAPNVGALHNYLARLRSRPDFQDLARRAKSVIEKIPGPAHRIAAGLRHGITHYLAPEDTGTLFEEMGFEYIGPIDGHDLPTMLDVFRKVRELDYPVFVHALTIKGKGYEVAEDDSRKWHGVGAFDVEAQEIPKKGGAPMFTQVFGDAMIEVAQEDPRIVAITAAMPDGTGLTGFSKELPDRYYDVGIAEQHAVTFAAGLAAGGVRPFCVVYSTFLQRAFDQVLHDVAIQNLPVRFVMDRAGLVGDDGPTHHGAFDISYLSCIPNIVQMASRDATELREMIKFMAGFDSGPITLRYPRGASEDVLPESRTSIQLGKAEILGSPCVGAGSDKGSSKDPDAASGVPVRSRLNPSTKVAIVAIGSMVVDAWRAAEALLAQGVVATVVNARFIKPLDIETIASVATECGAVVTVEENVRSGGFGQQVRDALAGMGLDHVPVEIVSLPDAFVEHGAQPLIRPEAGLSPEAICSAVAKIHANTKIRMV